jgi:hypothetical protein
MSAFCLRRKTGKRRGKEAMKMGLDMTVIAAMLLGQDVEGTTGQTGREFDEDAHFERERQWRERHDDEMLARAVCADCASFHANPEQCARLGFCDADLDWCDPSEPAWDCPAFAWGWSACP